MNDLWWVRLPILVSRLSRGLAMALADGFYLTARPAVAALAPALALVGGIGLGWTHLGPGETYTYSLPLVAIMLSVGTLSAGLGGWLLVGYVIGDTFLAQHLVYDVAEPLPIQVLRLRLPLLLSYVLLAHLLVAIPLIVSVVRQQVPARLGGARMVGGNGLGLLVLGVLVYLWTQAVPTLIRPVFTWQGGAPPPIQAIAPLQELWWVPVSLGVAAMAVRIALEASLGTPPAARRVEVYAAVARATPPGGVLLSPLRAALRAALTTLMLAGIVEGVVEGVVLFIVLGLLFWSRDLVQDVLPAWAQLVSRVPVLLRLGGALALSSVVATQTLNLLWGNTNTFLPILLSVVISLLIFAVLIPPTSRLAKA